MRMIAYGDAGDREVNGREERAGRWVIHLVGLGCVDHGKRKARTVYAAGFVFALWRMGATFGSTFSNRIAGTFAPAAVSYGLHRKNAANSDHMTLSLNSHGERCIIHTVSSMVRHKMLTMIVFCDISACSFYREALTFHLLKAGSVRASG